MLTRNDGYAAEVRHQYRGGIGDITVETLARPEEYYNKGRMLGRVTIPVGGSVGYHRHEGDMELFYVLSGQMCCEQEGESYLLSAGDTITCPSGEGHSIANAGDEPLVYLAVIIFQ